MSGAGSGRGPEKAQEPQGGERFSYFPDGVPVLAANRMPPTFTTGGKWVRVVPRLFRVHADEWPDQ